jgi:hypothetical protein
LENFKKTLNPDWEILPSFVESREDIALNDLVANVTKVAEELESISKLLRQEL